VAEGVSPLREDAPGTDPVEDRVIQRKVDLVLINPGSRTRVYQALGQSLSAIEPPIWAGLMATYVRRRGFGVEVLDAEALDLAPEDVAKQVSVMAPRLAAVVVYGHQPSASTQVMPAARAVCAALKAAAPETKVLLLGGHVAALPQRTLEEEPADFVAGGEGLQTLVDLCAALASPSPNLSQVHDLWYRDAGAVHFTKPAPLLRDLDGQTPEIAWDLLPMPRYRAHNWHTLGYPSRQPYAAIYTTLGCPHRCSFCCIQAPFKSGEAAAGLNPAANSYRLWDPRLVVDQLELLHRDYGVTHVKFADEMFVLNPRHADAICTGIIERKLNLNIWAYARVDSVRDGMLPKLKAAGFNWLAFGIEAANPRVRDDVQKGFDQDDIRATLAKVAAAGIHVIGNFIFGLPEDDLATMQETLDLALELNCEFANFYCTMAYPGSALYQAAVREGWPLPETWGGYSQHAVDCLPLPTRHVSAGEVLAFRDAAFQTYYTNPAYLAKVQRLFGAEAVTHIRQMTAHKLERRRATPVSA
jgi:anaerobic magnesium-protoporphyrin IX monomethyl ester cyclase